MLMAECATIFSDNEAAVRRVQQAMAGVLSKTSIIQHPDRDLLFATLRIVQSKPRDAFKVVWIKAHRQLYDACGT